MALITVGLGGTETINTSGDNSVSFSGLGTLDITGATGAPIAVTISSLAGLGLLDTVNITNASVTLGGAAGVSALTAFNIGAGGRLNLTSLANVAAGSTITFTGQNSVLGLAPGLDLSVLSAINGFAPGSAIDVPAGAASLTYTDNAGNGTGGLITLRDSTNAVVSTVPINTGEYTAGSFRISPDGSSGTLISFATGITSVTINPANGTLGIGGTAAITVTTGTAVTVAGGTPTLTLNDGGTAVYDAAASTPTSLVFVTTVAAGQNTADLAISGVGLGGATVTDGLGIAFDLTPAAVNPAGTLVVDTTAPTITGVTTTPGSGALGAGQGITIRLTTSEAVTVAGGTPTLTLSDGSTATYIAGASTPTSLAFTTTVAAGQNTPDLTVTAINPNGATVRDAANNAADLTGAVTNPAGTLVIDTTAPTVTGVTTNPASGSLRAGQTVAITVTTSEAVTVVPLLPLVLPTLTLNDGGIATYDPNASTSTSLVFTTTVAAGQNTPDLAITAVNLNGAIVSDAAGNVTGLGDAAINPAGTLSIDTVAPTVSGVTTNPASGTVGAGQSVAITVATTEPVAVTGTPTLTLSNGGTATYDPTASTTTALVFTTTVAAGQNAADLAVTAVNPNGGTVQDAAGNPANLAAAIGNPPGVLVIDATAPQVTGITASPANGVLGVGGTASLTITLDEAVTVTGGTPTLTLNDGGVATYFAAASTSTSLVFVTTVAAGQNTADLAVTAVNPNGATVADAAGNAANLTGAIANPAGTLAVDTTPPTITGITTNPGSGTFGVGQVITLTLTPSEAIVIAGGTPTLTLSDGGTATYSAAASTSTALVFTTTVTAGQNTPDLTVTSVNPNGAFITDNAGNSATLSGALTNPAGTLVIDTTAPTITGVTANPATGSLGAGQTVTITLATSEAVTVTGTPPTLTLSDGGTATYNAAASTPTALAFTTTVAAGQNTPDLQVLAVNTVGAVIADAAGNAANLAAAVANPAGTLVIDTTAPTVAGVTTNPGAGTVGTGQTVAITVATTEPVTVAGGTPTLSLSDGGTATYNAAASTPTALVFTTTVAAGQNTPDLTITGVNLGTATVTDAAGNAANLTAAITNPAGILVVDSVAPTVTGVTTNPSSGTLTAGQPVAITVATTEPVTVTGTPTLSLSDGGTATYNPGASTSTALVFTTTVAAGQATPDLAVTGVNLNTGSVVDAGGNAADLSGAITNPPGTLVIDAAPPVVTAVIANPANALLGIGGTASLTVTLNEAATVTGGPPTLSLNDGGTATYNAAASTPTALVFTTTVAAGQNTADLAVTAVNLNGATVADAAGNASTLAGAVTNPAGTLAVDGTAPTVTATGTNPASGTLAAGQTVSITVALSEAVGVTGGTPTLSLNDGGIAAYNAAASTPTALVFTTTIAAGQNANGLGITAVNLNSATVADTAGNPANLNGAVGALPGGLVIDTVPPTITTVTTTPPGGTIPAGTPIGITVGTSEPVTVNGGPPTLSLNNGGTATYVPGSSTPTGLVFTYTPAPGDDVADLAVTGLNLNGGSITDAAGNPANLAGAAVNPAGTLAINTGFQPFAPLVVTSTDTTGTITVTAATRPFVAGTFSNLGGGAISADGATYTVSGTLAQVNAALQGVTLNPARGSATLAGYTASVADNNTAATTRLTNTSALGSTLAAVSAGDGVVAGSGTDTLQGGSAAGTLLTGGAGADVLVGSTGGSTMVGGLGSSTFFTTGGNSLAVGKGPQDVFAATGGNPVVFTAAGGRSVVSTGAGSAVVVGAGQDTVVAGSGSMLAALATGTIAFSGSGSATYFASQGTTVVGGTGATLVGVRGTGALVYSGAGPTTFLGGTGNSTVIGGSGGGSALFAGAGGGLFGGGRGGNNTLVGGTGATTLFGGGNGDILYGVGSAGTVMVAGSGNETLQGALSSGNDLFYLGGGTTLVGLGSGQDVVYAGTGAATVVAGSGKDLFAFVNGQTGGSIAILGFKTGTDKLALAGYDANEAARASAAAVVATSGGVTSTTITLSDNTRITFLGASSLPANAFS